MRWPVAKPTPSQTDQLSVPTQLRMNRALANTPFWLQNSEQVEGEGRASLLPQVPEITKATPQPRAHARSQNLQHHTKRDWRGSLAI